MPSRAEAVHSRATKSYIPCALFSLLGGRCGISRRRAAFWNISCGDAYVVDGSQFMAQIVNIVK
jgi:hypothetical protein